MFPIFLNALSRARGQILGWGLSLGLLGMYMAQFYDTIARQQEQILQLIRSYPPELMAFFGEVDLSAGFTPESYLSVELLSYMPLILGIFAVLAGSGLVASDEESGTLDLLLAHPVSRTGLFMGRLLAFVTSTLAILTIIWLGLALGVRQTELLKLTPGEMARPMLSLLAVLLLFGALAALLSMLLPSRRLAATTAGLVLVASFFLSALARLDDRLLEVARLLPLEYYQSGEAISGLNWNWFIGLLGFALLFAVLAWWRFERRDIRVGGEGGWRLALPWSVARRAGRRSLPAAPAIREG